MAGIRGLVFGLVAAATLAGCGHAPASAPVALRQVSASLPTALVAGQVRSFGYDLDRFEALKATREATASLEPPHDMPPAVDNRAYCSKVADQGKLGACTAFALGRGLREYMQKRNGERLAPLSPLWLYYKEREHMGAQYVQRDCGSTLMDGAWVLLNEGCATESLWPYLLPSFAVAPSAAADASALANRLRQPSPISGLEQTRWAIARGQAVAFGFKAYESLRQVGTDGVMPMPQPNERLLGGHAVLAVGYDDAKQQLIVRNSWGAGFGDHGYFYMPYAFFQDSTHTLDFWTADR